jgi:hypothetical protein
MEPSPEARADFSSICSRWSLRWDSAAVKSRESCGDHDDDVWVVIRAIDSSSSEVWSDDKCVHQAIRSHFRVVERISDGAG